MFKFMAAVAALLTLSACASLPNPLDASTRQTLFVKDVSTAWSYQDAKKADNAGYQANKTDIQARLKTVVAAAFATSPAGSEAVEFKIDIKTFDVSSIGGTVVADVSVVRLSDGVVIGVYKDVIGQQIPGGGLLGMMVQAMVKPDVVGMVSTSFATNMRARFNAAK